MAILNAALLILVVVTGGVGWYAFVRLLLDGYRRWMRGRWLSRPAIRLLGYKPALLLRGVLAVTAVAFLFAHTDIDTYRALLLLLNVWLIDDWFTGGDRPRRRHDWVRARLRKLKPLKLRPVERWAPEPV